MNKENLVEKVKKFPETPGVYIMRDTSREILYIGKATSLKHRVLSYFQRPQEARIEKMLSQICTIEIKETDSVIEALLLEVSLIKKCLPKYNVKLKDNKTYLGIFVTREEWPRVFPARSTEDLPKGDFYGPFPVTGHVREALQIIRKLFPFRVSCEPLSGKACFEYHLGMCPGVCAGKVDLKDYQETIRQLRQFMSGNKKSIVKRIEKEMKDCAKKNEFEKAGKLRDKLFALKHIQDVALIKEEDTGILPEIPRRIEAYDISNISGVHAVGSMVVFTDGLIDKKEYRKFKINPPAGSVVKPDDVAMMQEVLVRRFNHPEWKMPDLVLVDGGKGQVNMAKRILKLKNLDIPVVGLAKGPDRDKDELIADKDLIFDKKILIRARDEAHRFAITYYRTLHKNSLKK